jgi:hypothetical protein
VHAQDQRRLGSTGGHHILDAVLAGPAAILLLVSLTERSGLLTVIHVVLDTTMPVVALVWLRRTPRQPDDQPRPGFTPCRKSGVREPTHTAATAAIPYLCEPVFSRDQ